MLRSKSEWEDFLDNRKTKVLVFTALVSIGFALIIFRLWHLQIVQYATLSNRADSNRIRQLTVDGRRGKIFDSGNIALVDSRPSFLVSIIPEDVDDPEKTLKLLRERIEFDIDEVLAKMKVSSAFKPVMIQRDVPRSDIAFIEERRMELPGVLIETRAIRNYIFGKLGAHLIGYLGAISPEEYAKAPKSVYAKDDYVGKNGIEKMFEEVIRGQKGLKRIEVDAAGRQLSQLGLINPRSGSDLHLTIDYDTQAAAERGMEGKMGSAVAIDPQTGALLAFVNRPTFDPNKFAYGISKENWRSLMDDDFHPLQNRATQGQYPPGSTFKIVVAAAALEERIINKNTVINCPGHFYFGGRPYRCWKRSGHGLMDIKQALIQSCDVYFYTIGDRLGIDKIAKYAKMFGLGAAPDLKLGKERAGIVPTQEWKKRVIGERWWPGETLSCSIGQGFVLTTPLQQARMIAAIANKGKLVWPQLVRRIDHPDEASFLEKIKANPPIEIPIKKRNLAIISEALKGVVSAKRGTAWRLKNGKYQYAGKTGTSQVIKLGQKVEKDIEKIKLKYRDHGWFVGFAPYDNPRIAVAVLAEHGGHGGEAAAPVAQMIMDAYLTKIGIPPREEPEKTGPLAALGRSQ